MDINHFWAVCLTVISALISLTPIMSALNQQAQLRHARKAETAELRLREIIYPLFVIIEPYMKSFRLLSVSDAQSVLDILQKNGPMIGNLLEYQELLQNCIQSPSSRTSKRLDHFFLAVNSEYDAICKELGIPKRSVRYRIKNYRFIFARAVLLSIAVSTAVLIAMTCDVLFLIAAAQKFFQTGVFPYYGLMLSVGITFILIVLNEGIGIYLDS